MDARRFDLLARGFARFGTRRSLLRSFAIAAGATASGATAARALDADSESFDAVGGTDATDATDATDRSGGGACRPTVAVCLMTTIS